MSDLAEIEALAGALLKRVSPGERRQLLRAVARDLQKGQAARIGRQQAPDGTPYPERRSKPAPQPGAHTVHFLYPKGSPEPRPVLMKSWVKEGDKLTGFDIERGAIRSFEWDRIARWLPVEESDRRKAGGKYRRKGRIRRAAMFRKLRNGRYLKAGATDTEAWVGFSGRASAIATIHQDGGEDRPAPKGRKVRYAKRELLGSTEADRQRMLDMLLAHMAE